LRAEHIARTVVSNTRIAAAASLTVNILSTVRLDPEKEGILPFRHP
jgi:hypothetical protein